MFSETCGSLSQSPSGTMMDPNDVTMDLINKLCPAFKKGKACPYKAAAADMKGLGTGCPAFKNGCPFKDVKTVGEFRDKLGEMRDKCTSKIHYTKALELIFKANKETAAAIGHCPFHQDGCKLKTDKKGKPIQDPNTVTMNLIKELCPAFEKGKACPYKDLVAEMKGWATGCPAFNNGCPFKDVKDVGEFRAKLGEMRDMCPSKVNYTKALELIFKANKEKAAAIGHCPFHEDGCKLKTDKKGKPIQGPNTVTMDLIKELCPAFEKGKACPYKDLVVEMKAKGMATGCPAFKGGCPFKDVKDVGEFRTKLGEMRDMCPSKVNYTKALELIFKANKEKAAAIGHCPFHEDGCKLKTDKKGKPIQDPNAVTMDFIKELCPAFEKGKACPYKAVVDDMKAKGMANGCPAFKGGCPFKDVKDVGEFRDKMGEMRDMCPSKANHKKAVEMIHEANKGPAAAKGHCPFHEDGCKLMTDRHGKPIV